ncbi:MAG: hypothetical protein WD423_05805 [Rhodothermales bacterium]
MTCDKWFLFAAGLALGLIAGGCDWAGPDASGERGGSDLNDVLNDRLPLADSPARIFCDLSHFDINLPGGFGPDPSIETDTGCGVRLTRSVESQAMAIYLGNPIALEEDGSFRTHFSFRIHGAGGAEDDDGPGADGFVFVLQRAAASALGVGGGSLGYGRIWASAGVEFDTYSNHGLHAGDEFINDPDGNHVGINVEGSLESLETASVPKRLNDGDVWWVWIDYDGQVEQLSVRLSESEERPADALLSAEIDIPGVLGGTTAWIGFTAATGGGYQRHDILSWQFQTEGRSIAE